MAQTRIHRIFALSMAFWMLFASVGTAADFHFCQGEFKSFALFAKAKSCHELAATPSCHKKSVDKEETKCATDHEDGCCTNHTEIIQLDLDLVFAPANLDEGLDFDSNISPIEPINFEEKLEVNSPFLDYKPPILVVNRLTLFQQFLC